MGLGGRNRHHECHQAPSGFPGGSLPPVLHLTAFLGVLILTPVPTSGLSGAWSSGSTGVCPGRDGGRWILQGTEQAVELLIRVISVHL